MKTLLGLSLLATLALSGCTTVIDGTGQQRQVMTPMGAGVVQALVSTGVGVGTGALMKNSPSWATGGVAGGAGSIASQVVNSFIPQSPQGYQAPSQQYYPQQPQYQPQQYQPVQYQQPQYQQQPVQFQQQPQYRPVSYTGQ